MRWGLLSLSAWCLIRTVPVQAQVPASVQVDTLASGGMFDLAVGEKRVYRLSGTYRTYGITGLLVLKQQKDRIKTGSIVNEFGVKLGDFVYMETAGRPKNGKWRWRHLPAKLRFSPVKGLLRRDLAYLLSAPLPYQEESATVGTAGVRRLRRMEDDSVELQNIRTGITYTIRLVKDDETSCQDHETAR